MRLFELDSIDKGVMKKELNSLAKNTDEELKKLLSWQINYCQELLVKNNIKDKVMIYGAADKFNERIEKPSLVQLSEIYDIENDVKKIKQEGYEVIGGLGGFSFNSGRYAGELIFLPGGSCIRVHLDHGKHTAMLVAPMNIYPLCVFTARKYLEDEEKGDQIFIVIFEKGEKISNAIEKIATIINDSKKTITGIVSGSFSNISGYIFSSASPKTVLTEFSLNETKNLFLYQTLLAEGVQGFQRTVHTHGFEAAKFGEPHAFGAHIHNADVNIAIGIFVVAEDIERK